MEEMEEGMLCCSALKRNFNCILDFTYRYRGKSRFALPRISDLRIICPSSRYAEEPRFILGPLCKVCIAHNYLLFKVPQQITYVFIDIRSRSFSQ